MLNIMFSTGYLGRIPLKVIGCPLSSFCHLSLSTLKRIINFLNWLDRFKAGCLTFRCVKNNFVAFNLI